MYCCHRVNVLIRCVNCVLDVWNQAISPKVDINRIHDEVSRSC